MRNPIMMYLLRIIHRIRKVFFAKQFQSFDLSSGIGTDGAGKGCEVIGAKYISVGRDCYLGRGTVITALRNHFDQVLNPSLNIGNHVRCVGGCRITCANSIILENNVLLGPEVYITDHNHGMNPEFPGGYSKQPLLTNKVVIKEGVWLGERVSVLPGVTIGQHSIIGTNSVVTHDIPPYSIAVGVPARVIKKYDFKLKQWLLLKEQEMILSE